MYGAERLESLLRTNSGQEVDLLIERAEAGVRAFRGAAEPFDDLTSWRSGSESSRTPLMT